MRLFVAVNFPPEVKAALSGAVDSLRTRAGGNFSRPENFHLTLAFIGETRDAAGAKAALDSLSSPPFSAAVAGSGRFGDTWWAGLEPSPELDALARETQEALRSRGFAIERRSFLPHVTLAREVSAGAGTALSVPRAAFQVRRVSLMRSDRIQGRLTYTEIYGKELKSAPHL